MFVFVEQFRPAVMASRYLINIYIVLQKDLRGHREVTLSKTGFKLCSVYDCEIRIVAETENSESHGFYACIQLITVPVTYFPRYGGIFLFPCQLKEKVPIIQNIIITTRSW